MRVGDGFMALADRRIFVTMAFLNATGFDVQPQGVPMHPVRQRVRQRMAENLAQYPEKLQEWRQYAQSRGLANFQCQSFCLSLQADYPFQRIRPDAELGYPATAKLLRDFPEILRDFWITTELTNIWNEVKPEYIAELEKYDLEQMRRRMTFLWAYLRMPRPDALTIIHVPDLLDSHYHAMGAQYEAYYYCVEGPGAQSYSLDFHEYLHSIVNPWIQTNYPGYKNKLRRYYEDGEHRPLSRTYREPVTFTAECLVRALDSRLEVKWADDRATAQGIEGKVAWCTDQGLTLTRPFYELLGEYEAQDASFAGYLPVMLARLPDARP
jgi:hypothetical protein